MQKLAIALCAAVLVGLSSLLAADAGQDVDVTALPQAVAQAVETRFPSAEIVSATRLSALGQVRYDLEIELDGQLRAVEVSSEGRLLSGAPD